VYLAGETLATADNENGAHVELLLQNRDVNI